MKLTTFILILIITDLSFAQTGNLAGKVSDGEFPIPLVNVILLDAGYGAAAAITGYYYIRCIHASGFIVEFIAIVWERRTVIN